MRTAREGVTVRSISLALYTQWLDGESQPRTSPGAVDCKRKAPPWFGSVKVDEAIPHDMASVRASIALRRGE